MARVKRAVNAKKKRRTVLNRAKGYYGQASRSYKYAKEQVQHSLQSSTAIAATRSVRSAPCGSLVSTLLLA